jgi:sigma-B regulation protein RsbU (phosphoserine phosphatase)
VAIGLRFRSYLKGKHLEQQVEIAHQVQQDLLPAPNQELPYARYAAECVPAWGVGGDFHDAFAVDGGVALVLGDVSGKGIPAALLMGVIHGAVRSSSWAESARRHEECSRKLNQLLCERASGARYASMFWSYYNPESGSLHYINAGHCPPLLVQTRHGRTAIRRLEEGGPVLGLLSAARYEQSTETLDEGDMLVLYSDGVIEAANAAGEEFGEARLMDVLVCCSMLSAEEIRFEVVSAVQDFVGPAKAHDDLTLVAVRFDRVADRVTQILNESEMAVA